MAHFPVLVIGDNPDQVIERYCIYREGSKEEHDDGKFDYAQAGGIFEKSLITIVSTRRKPLLGFIPRGKSNETFQTSANNLDIDQTLKTDFSAFVTDKTWTEFASDNPESNKEKAHNLLRNLSPSTLITVFDCHI